MQSVLPSTLQAASGLGTCLRGPKSGVLIAYGRERSRRKEPWSAVGESVSVHTATVMANQNSRIVSNPGAGWASRVYPACRKRSGLQPLRSQPATLSRESCAQDMYQRPVSFAQGLPVSGVCATRSRCSRGHHPSITPPLKPAKSLFGRDVSWHVHDLPPDSTPSFQPGLGSMQARLCTSIPNQCLPSVASDCSHALCLVR